MKDLDELPLEIPELPKLLLGHAQVAEIPDLPEKGLIALGMLLKHRQSEPLPHPADPDSRPS